jgi:hypothetical protein
LPDTYFSLEPIPPLSEHSSISNPARLGHDDVVALLTELAQKRKKKVGNLNWRESIVDLLKLLDINSNGEARKQLAQKLGVTVGDVGSAERNIALHTAVLRELAENGGQVPPKMRS